MKVGYEIAKRQDEGDNHFVGTAYPFAFRCPLYTPH